MLRTTLLIVGCGLLSLSSAAAAADSLAESLKQGEVDIDLRYRYEWVEEDGFDRNANASTIRLRLGYTTPSFRGLFSRAEFQGNFSLGNDYNSTENGRTQFPVVTDPQDSNFSQLLVGYRLHEKNEFKLGRQVIVLDNERFFGPVGWRQLYQTFDAVSARSGHFENVTLTYAYLGNVIRVFGEHHPDDTRAETDQDSHLFHAAWDSGVGRLVGYVHLLDFPDNEPASHRNLGARFSGKREFERWHLVYEGEYADQSSYRDGDSAIDAQYTHLVGGAGCPSGTLKLGYELLGGDGSSAFQTPFATLHTFNGWADKFLSTPSAGLQDLYLSLDGKFKGIQWAAIQHDFSPDSGSAGYGSELDLLVTRTWNEKYTAAVKYADYSADGDATGAQASDTRKFWLWLQYKD